MNFSTILIEYFNILQKQLNDFGIKTTEELIADVSKKNEIVT